MGISLQYQAFGLLFLLIFTLGTRIKSFALSTDNLDNLIKGTFHIDTSFGWCLNKIACKSSCHHHAFFSSDFTFSNTIALVTNKHHGDIFNILDSKDLFTESFNAFKCRASCNRINKQEAFTITNPLITQSRIFLFLKWWVFCINTWQPYITYPDRQCLILQVRMADHQWQLAFDKNLQ